MSLSEKELTDIKDLLTNTKNDLNDFVSNFMDFFTPSELRPTIKFFQQNLEFVSSGISSMHDALSDVSKFQGLSNHGLVGSELTRKMNLYSIIRNDYHNSKFAFVESFLDLGQQLETMRKNELTTVKDLPTGLRKFYERVRLKLRNLKISKERFYEFLNSILQSLADALGVGGIVSEYKDSVEIATKKETAVQFNVIVFSLGPDLFEKMKKYANTNDRALLR